MLTDSFGRVHDYLRISLTEKCNLRCTYCMPEDGVPHRDRSCFMTAEEVIQISGLFVDAGVKKIRLTGGEPLVCKDAKKILEGLSRFPVELAITTNGILVDEFIETFKKAGLKSVNVSLDTLDSEKFEKITRRDKMRKVMTNIHLLLMNGFKVKVNVVAMRDVNEDELIQFVEWTRNFPLHVRFIEFMPFDGNKWDRNTVLSCDEILKHVQSVYSVEKLPDSVHDTSKKFRVPGFRGTFAVITTISDPFCSSCNRLRLSSSGKLRNCLFSPAETDLLTPMRNGENILPLIHNTVQKKFFSKGGVGEWEDVRGVKMVSIGG